MAVDDSSAKDQVSLVEAAALLDVHYMTAYRYIRTGRLEATKSGGQWRIRTTDLERFRTGRASDAPPEEGPGLDRWSQRYESRLLAADQVGAWQVLDNCRAAGNNPIPILLKIVEPAIARAGEDWANGTMTLAAERQATVVAEQHIGRLIAGVGRPGPSRGSVVIGCIAGEQHDIGLLVVSGVLRGDGFTPINLGADTPISAFESACQSADRLVAVGVGSHNSETTRSLRRVLKDLRAALPDVPLVVGGHVTSSSRALGLDADHISVDLLTTANWLRQAAPT